MMGFLRAGVQGERTALFFSAHTAHTYTRGISNDCFTRESSHVIRGVDQ